MVHSVVLEAFKGPRPPKNVSRHMDGVRQNNCIENLEWGTSAQNAEDAKRHGTFVLGEKNGYAKLKSEDVRKIRELKANGVVYTALGRMFNIHWITAWCIIKGKTWRHLT